MSKWNNVAKWMILGEQGVSSRTMVSIACGQHERLVGMDAPRDGGDFKRCLKLVEMVPEVLDQFDRIAKIVPEFKYILENWEELAKLANTGSNDAEHELYKKIHEYYTKGSKELYNFKKEK